MDNSEEDKAMAVHTETALYKLETTRNGLFVVLTRKADGANVHFQDDAAAEIIELAEECEHLPEHRREEFTNYAFSQYDDVMEKRS